MSEVFISYSREDRSRAKKIAKRLQQLGLDIWWDREIPPGRSFDEVIQEALESAKCVIVLWSKVSVESHWVKEEAQRGLDRGILIPVLVDPVPIPLGFGRVQTGNLSDWDGAIGDADFIGVSNSVATMVGRNELIREMPKLRSSSVDVPTIPIVREPEWSPAPRLRKPPPRRRKSDRGKRAALVFGSSALLAVVLAGGMYYFFGSQPASRERGSAAPDGGTAAPPGEQEALAGSAATERSGQSEQGDQPGYYLRQAASGGSIITENHLRAVEPTRSELAREDFVGWCLQSDLAAGHRLRSEDLQRCVPGYYARDRGARGQMLSREFLIAVEPVPDRPAIGDLVGWCLIHEIMPGQRLASGDVSWCE